MNGRDEHWCQAIPREARRRLLLGVRGSGRLAFRHDVVVMREFNAKLKSCDLSSRRVSSPRRAGQGRRSFGFLDGLHSFLFIVEEMFRNVVCSCGRFTRTPFERCRMSVIRILKPARRPVRESDLKRMSCPGCRSSFVCDHMNMFVRAHIEDATCGVPAQQATRLPLGANMSSRCSHRRAEIHAMQCHECFQPWRSRWPTIAAYSG